MKNEELKLMIDKNIIHKGNIIQLSKCSYMDWKILDIMFSEKLNCYLFKIQNIETKNITTVKQSDIGTIEDMPFDRFIQAYEIDDELNTIEIYEKTNVLKDIFGKKRPSLFEYKLFDGMKLILHNDKTEKYNDKVLTVRGVGDNVVLVCPRGRPKQKE